MSNKKTDTNPSETDDKKLEESTVEVDTPKTDKVDVEEEVDFPGLLPCELDNIESRAGFTPDDKVEVHPTSTIFMTSELHNPNYYDKLFPDGLKLEKDQVSVAIGEYSNNHNVMLFKEHKGRVANIIDGIDEDGEVRRTAISKTKVLNKGSTLVGEAAILAITTKLGNGVRIEVPLVNSGFRIAIDRLDGDDLAILDEQLLTAKGEFGRMTIGSSMGFNSAYLKRDIINTILRRLREHNLEGVEQGDIDAVRRRIMMEDYESLLVAVLAATRPDGYYANVPCPNIETECKHITTGYVHPARCWHVDHSKLTNRQLEIITRPLSVKVSAEELSKYREDFKIDGDTFTFTKGGSDYVFKFTKCTLENNVRAGIRWATNINKAVSQYLTSFEEDDVRRKRIMTKTLNVNSLSQFGGWVASIAVYDSETKELELKVEDAESVIGVLKTIYDDENVTDLFDKLYKFIYSGNPVTVGVEEFTCLKCGPIKNKESKRVLVPLDIEALFFIHLIDPALLNNHFVLTDLTM